MDTLDIIEQESKKVPFTLTSLQWGFIGGLANILLLLILYVTGNQYQSGWQSLGILIMFGSCYYCTKAVRQAHPLNMIRFGQAFSASFLCGVVISIIGILFFLVYVNFIDTGYYDMLPQIARAKMMEQGLSPEQVDRAIQIQGRFMTPGFTMAFAAAGNIFLALVISLVCGGILKRSHASG